MSAPFTDQLRARAGTITIPGDGARLTVRVQYLEGWDAVRVDAPATTSVLGVKTAALAVLEPGVPVTDDFVVKHRGVELLDERLALAAAGIPDHGILSVSHRRRRPVR